MRREPERSEVDRRIGEILKEIFDENPELLMDPDIQIPPPDFSFLQEKEEKRRKRNFHRWTRVAVLVVVILTASGALALLTSDGMADSLKSRLGKFIYQFDKEIVMVPGSAEIDKDVLYSETSIEIDDLENLDAARIFLKDLYVPSYVPEGYEFVTLSIFKQTRGDYQGTYEYVDEEGNSLQLVFVSHDGLERSKERVRNAVMSLEMKDRILYICEEELPQQLMGVMITDEVSLFLNSILPEEEIVKVLQNLER